LNKIKSSTLLITLIIALSPQGLSQDLGNLDDDYLNSLPDEIKADVMKEIKSSKDSKQTKYTVRPSTKINNLEIIKNWEKFLQEESESTKSERYGMSIFRSMQTSFMPINEPNFNGSYILDFGDVIEVQVISQNSYVESVEVKRDGTVAIEDIGKISVSGLSLETASNLIINKIESSIIGSKGFVSLINIRDIQVLITGQALFPGIYTLNGGSNLLHALNVAGGITEKGSFREVEIKRNGKVVETVDLYEVLIFGNASYNSKLRSGDSIYIKPVLNLARTTGAFNIEAIFELNDSESLSDLVKFAGGVSKNILNNEISLNRLVNGEFKRSILNLDNLYSYKVANNDSIYASKKSNGTVEIRGQVASPGKYQINNQDTLLSIVNRAGGYLPSAYTLGSALFTEKAKKIQTENNDRLYKELIKFLVSSGTSSNAQQSSGLASTLPMLIADIKDIKPLGRVYAEFDILELQDDPNSNTYLNDGDKIVIPKFDNSIYIYGEVMNPGALAYKSGKTTNEYVANSGGYSKFAEIEYAVIIFPNGSAEIVNSSSGILKKLSGNSIDIYPGSVIYIPREMGAVRGINYASTFAPIISSLALTIASVVAIQNSDNSDKD
tara:strand:+ start:777 stop:2606 length:1830 start_codon:yes stop_codon:yes gene_type:complete